MNKQFSKSILADISANRAYLMGIAMLLVLIFHFFCWTYNPLGRFNIGYVGVDVFLFLSGFGLAHSFEKNSLAKFYFNRLKRIYPIYIIAVCTTYIIFPLKWSCTDLINNLLTAGFYVDGGINRYDWYIESIFTLYLLFPIFYLLRRSKYCGLTITFIVTALVLHFTNLSWWYDCLIGRLPIFLYGVMYKNLSNKSFYVIGVIGLLLYIPCYIFSSPFLASSCLVPIIIILALRMIKMLSPKQTYAITYMGQHSFEIYIANLYIYWLFQLYDIGLLLRIVLCITMQFFVSFILIQLNNRLQRM